MEEGKEGKIIEEIKNEILGKDYGLSFSFVDVEKIKELNKQYRQKDEPTDILSFSLDNECGEILICKEVAKKKAKEFYPDFQNYFLFLLIHGMFHLKGLNHGVKMEQYEHTYYSRYRHRHL